MRLPLVLAALAVSSCTHEPPASDPGGPGPLDVGVGTVVAPAGFAATHAVATDTTVGTVTDGQLSIAFSIGGMAGTQMHAGRRGECAWFETQAESMLTLLTACELAGEGPRQLVVSVTANPIPGAFFPDWGYPANFSAEIDDDAERDTVLAIASSYAPSEAVTNRVVWVPRGIESRADSAAPGSGSHPGLTMVEVDPVAIRPTIGSILGSTVTWHQRDATGAFLPVQVSYVCTPDFREVTGPPGVPEHDLRVEVVVFETLVPCGTAWDAFSSPLGEGYRELYRTSIPRGSDSP